MRFLLLLNLLLFSFPLNAQLTNRRYEPQRHWHYQPGHWRLGLGVGSLTPYTTFQTSQSLPAGRMAFSNRLGFNALLSIERSVGAYVSLRGGVGYGRFGQMWQGTNQFADPTGRIAVRSMTASESQWSERVMGMVGLSLNTAAIGRFIFIAGLDLNALMPLSAMATNAVPLHGILTYNGQKQSFDYVIRREPERGVTPTLTGRLGTDIRLTNRLFVSLGASYTHGFGIVERISSEQLLIDGVPYQATANDRGRAMSVSVGIKQSLGRAKLSRNLLYTPYNGPSR